MSNIPTLISAAMKMESSYVASVVLTGLAVVFLALLLLILVFKIFGAVFSGKPKEKTKPKVKAAKADDAAKPVKSSVETLKPEKPAAMSSVPMIEDGIDTEIVAVIAAAIAAMSASSGKKLRLVSVKSLGSSRRAWAQAGLSDNTRPF